jgi:hypothetical protein
MTTDPREPLTPEERGLAQRLARVEAHAAPPAALDAAILAAARAELAASIDQPATSLHAAPTSGQRQRPRWPTLLGLAASVTLAIGIAWQLRTPSHPAADMAASAPVSGRPSEAPVAAMERDLESGSRAATGAHPADTLTDGSNIDSSRQIAPEPMAAPPATERTPSTVSGPQAITSALSAPEVPATRQIVLPEETHAPLRQERDTNAAKPAPISRPSTTDVLESSVPGLSRDATVDSRSSEAFRRSRSQSPSAFPTTTPSPSIHTEKQNDLPASATLGRSAADSSRGEYSLSGAAAPPPPPSPVTASPPASSTEGVAEFPAAGPAVSDSGDASKVENRFSPQQWLQHIRELHDHGDLDAAKASLRRFRDQYPDITVPDDLRSLLDR